MRLSRTSAARATIPKRWPVWSRKALAAVVAGFAAGPALAAPCTVRNILELPVQIINARAIVTARIGDMDARFILDTGASQSTLSHAIVAAANLPTVVADPRVRLQGANGSANAELAIVPRFALGGMIVPQAQFVVGGSETGWAGLLGQNILGRYDIDYDFPHGMMRLVQVQGCPGTSAATWAADRPVTQLSIVPRQPPRTVHIRATVTLDGKPLQAIFDTGAPFSILTLAAARRAGMTIQSPNASPADYAGGIGIEQLPTWIGRFDRITIGDETIPQPLLRFAAVSLGDADMLIGFDFFIGHRVLLLNSRSRMLFTPEDSSGRAPASAGPSGP